MSTAEEPAWDQARPRYPSALIDRLARLADGGRVLDVASGTGDLARNLAARGLEVVALEPSGDRIDAGRRAPHGHRVHWRQGTPEGSPLGGPYDLVVVRDAVHQLAWDRALPPLGRATRGWFAVAGRGDRLDGGAEALDALLTTWSSDPAPIDPVAFVTGQRRFRRVGLWRARPQTLLQPVPIFVRALHGRRGLSMADLGSDRVEPFRRAVEAVIDRHHGGMVRLIASPWIVWGRIRRGNPQ